jgi:hypothetical protein
MPARDRHKKDRKRKSGKYKPGVRTGMWNKKNAKKEELLMLSSRLFAAQIVNTRLMSVWDEGEPSESDSEFHPGEEVAESDSEVESDEEDLNL